MKITKYKYSDPTWDFREISPTQISLFVGASGSGKSRLFNTLFNLGHFVSGGKDLRAGNWKISFVEDARTFQYELQAEPQNGEKHVVAEKLCEVTPSGTSVIFQRDGTRFTYNGQDLPKFSLTSPALFLLKEEPAVQVAHKAFGKILRRDFSGAALDKAKGLASVVPDVVAEIDRKKDKAMLLGLLDAPISPVLFLLKRSFTSDYEWVRSSFIDVFPFVKDLSVMPLADLSPESKVEGPQVVAIREHHLARWIPINEFSSGMLKVLVFLTDVAVLPDESVYMIDEYENSLGVNAIDAFPSVIADRRSRIQFLITSHHPHLINAIPMKDWFVFGRRGRSVDIKHGEELVSRYSLSKQEAFLQLINDPFYVQVAE